MSNGQQDAERVVAICDLCGKAISLVPIFDGRVPRMWQHDTPNQHGDLHGPCPLPGSQHNDGETSTGFDEETHE